MRWTIPGYRTALSKKMMMNKNYKECYLWGKERLEEARITEASLDARLLLEHICHTDRNTLLVHGDREVSLEEKAAYGYAIEQRVKRIPLQQITGVQEFMGLDFAVNEHVLIPRQDTEVLVEEVLRTLMDGSRILDMCTGSGCILLSLLHYSNDCTGVGADISEAALEVARRNCTGLERTVKRAEFRQSDLFADLEKEKFDVIVSNPPYIRSDVIPTLMEEVRLHEPLGALDGKEDGLYFYRKIIEDAPEYLKNGGMLFFEIGYDQGAEVSCLMEAGGFEEVTVVKDFAGLDRVVFGGKRNV